MKKQSVLAMAMVFSLTGGMSLPTQAAGVYSINGTNVSKNCVVVKSQIENLPEIKSVLEELSGQIQSGNLKDCTIITLSGCNQTGNGNQSDDSGTNNPDGDNSQSNGSQTQKPDNNQSCGNQTQKPDNNESGGGQVQKPDNSQPGGNPAEQPDNNQAQTPDTDTTEQPELDQGNLSYAQQILKLVNEERAKVGLHALRLDAELSAAALVRTEEIQTSFSHTRPDGRKFSSVLTDRGIRFTGAGENIAWGQTSPEKVMEAWMNSEGHRANILNAKYTKLGVGHMQNTSGRNYWTQLFTY